MQRSDSKIRLIIILSALFYMLTGCQSGGLDPVEFKEWVEDENNGIRQTILTDSVTLILQYTPPAYQVVMEKKAIKISNSEFANALEEYQGMICFKLIILDKDGKSAFGTINNSVDSLYHLFGLQNDFKLAFQKDTLPCLMYHYESHGGIGPDCMIIGFEGNRFSINEGFSFIYEDKVLNIGEVVFPFHKEAINKIPDLKTQ